MENIKKLYKYARTCDDQHQYKAILEAEMVSNTKGFTYNGSISPVPSIFSKKPSASKSLCQFTEVLDAKQKSAVCRLCAGN